MPRKDSSWIEKSGLYGTWTFTTQTMTDVGYYKGIAYVVMHLMPDPMQVKSCVMKGDKKNKACIEANNKACSHVGAIDNAKEECVNTETDTVEWSDVSAFFQFGFRLRTGIVRKTYHDVHTSDWLGPYNMILAPIEKHHQQYEEEGEETRLDKGGGGGKNHKTKDLYVSRYVNTPWTETQLQRPFASSAIFNFDSDILEDVVGTKAINATIIHAQKEWRGTPKTSRGVVHAATTAKFGSLREGRKTEAASDNDGSLGERSVSTPGGSNNDDPYSKYSRTCSHGDLRPILPRLEVEQTTHPSTDGKPPKTTYSMKLDYSMLSLPKKGIDDLYKWWPEMKNHLAPTFPLRGPYCYGKDPNRAYAIHLSYDSAANAEAATWKGVKGCVPPWPCWKGDPSPPAPPPSAVIPEDNHSEGSYILDPMGLEATIVYIVVFLLVISLIFNCQLANKLKGLHQQRSGGSHSDRGEGGVPGDGRPPSRPTPGAREALLRRQNGLRSNIRDVSPSDYLQEAAGDRSNSLEEPLLTTSEDDDIIDGGGGQSESREGVEESKVEAE